MGVFRQPWKEKRRDVFTRQACPHTRMTLTECLGFLPYKVEIWLIVRSPQHQSFVESLPGGVERWCILGSALERSDARVYHEPQPSAITSVPSSNRAYGFLIHGFPMFFLRRHAQGSSHKAGSGLAFR